MPGKIYQKQGNSFADITPSIVSDPYLIGYGRNIGEVFYSLIPLVDATVHLLDGSVIEGDGVYRNFVTYMAGLYADGEHGNLFATESNWQASVSAFGVCGKFVYDSTEGTLRLPRVTGCMQGTIVESAMGDLVEAGLPGISGTVLSGGNDTVNTGAFKTQGNSIYTNTSGSAYWQIVNFDASRSSSVYGNSQTVQPQAVKGYVYIVLANAAKAAISVDLDNVATDLNATAANDLSNLNAQGNVRMAHAAMPSSQYIDLTLPANGGSVTVPADGYLEFSKVSGNVSNPFITLKNTTNGYNIRSFIPGTQTTMGVSVCIPVSAGDIIGVEYTTAGVTGVFRLIYANGSAS